MAKKTARTGPAAGRKGTRRTARPPVASVTLAPNRANVRRVADEAAMLKGGPEKVRLADVNRRMHRGSDPATAAKFFVEWREEARDEPPDLARAIAAMKERFARTGKVGADDGRDGPGPGRPAAPKRASRGFLARHGETAAERRGRKERLELPVPAAPRRAGAGAIARLVMELAGTAPPTAPPRRLGAVAAWKGAANRPVARSVVRLLIAAGHPLRTEEIFAKQAGSAVAWTAPKKAEVLKGMLAGSLLERKAGAWWFAGEARPSRTKPRPPYPVLEGLYLAAAMEAVRDAGREVTASWIEAALGDARSHFIPGFLRRRLTAAAEPEGSPLHRTADGRFVWRG